MIKNMITITSGGRKLFTEAERISDREIVIESGFARLGSIVDVEIDEGSRKAQVTKKSKTFDGKTKLTLKLL